MSSRCRAGPVLLALLLFVIAASEAAQVRVSTNSVSVSVTRWTSATPNGAACAADRSGAGITTMVAAATPLVVTLSGAQPYVAFQLTDSTVVADLTMERDESESGDWVTVYTGLVGTTGSTSAIPFLTNAPVMVHRATILDSSSPGDFMVTVDSTEAGLSNLYNDKIGLTWFSAPEPGDVFTTCMATNPYVVWTESPIKADLSFETLEFPNSPSWEMIHDDVALGARYNYAPVITNSNLQFWRFTVGAGNPSVNTAYYVPVVEVGGDYHDLPRIALGVCAADQVWFHSTAEEHILTYSDGIDACHLTVERYVFGSAMTSGGYTTAIWGSTDFDSSAPTARASFDGLKIFRMTAGSGTYDGLTSAILYTTTHLDVFCDADLVVLEPNGVAKNDWTEVWSSRNHVFVTTKNNNIIPSDDGFRVTVTKWTEANGWQEKDSGWIKLNDGNSVPFVTSRNSVVNRDRINTRNVITYADNDGDGFGSASSGACQYGSSRVTNADDCDDTNADVYPGAPDLCGALAYDCDIGRVLSPALRWVVDGDGDGFASDIAPSVTACTAPAGTIADKPSARGDCNDADAGVYPGAGCPQLAVERTCVLALTPWKENTGCYAFDRTTLYSERGQAFHLEGGTPWTFDDPDLAAFRDNMLPHPDPPAGSPHLGSCCFEIGDFFSAPVQTIAPICVPFSAARNGDATCPDGMTRTTSQVEAARNDKNEFAVISNADGSGTLELCCGYPTDPETVYGYGFTETPGACMFKPEASPCPPSTSFSLTEIPSRENRDAGRPRLTDSATRKYRWWGNVPGNDMRSWGMNSWNSDWMDMATCCAPVCGDGVVDPGETCDDDWLSCVACVRTILDPDAWDNGNDEIQAHVILHVSVFPIDIDYTFELQHNGVTVDSVVATRIVTADPLTDKYTVTFPWVGDDVLFVRVTAPGFGSSAWVLASDPQCGDGEVNDGPEECDPPTSDNYCDATCKNALTADNVYTAVGETEVHVLLVDSVFNTVQSGNLLRDNIATVTEFSTIRAEIVLRGNEGGTPLQTADSVLPGDPQVEFSGLAAGTPYSVRMAAVMNAGGAERWSPWVEVRTPDAGRACVGVAHFGAAPSAFSARQVGDLIYFKFTDNSIGENRFNLYRDDALLFSFVFSAPYDCYTGFQPVAGTDAVSALTLGATYVYCVDAQDIVAEPEWASAQQSCRDVTVSWTGAVSVSVRSSDGRLGVAGTAVAIQFEGVVIASAETGQDGVASFDLQIPAASQGEIELLATFSKVSPTGLPHLYSCAGTDCTEMTFSARHLDTTHTSVTDQSSSALSGAVTYANTGGCPVVGAKVCVVSADTQTEVGCSSVEDDGGWYMTIPIGLTVDVIARLDVEVSDPETDATQVVSHNFVVTTPNFALPFVAVEEAYTIDFSDTTTRTLSVYAMASECNFQMGSATVSVTAPACGTGWSTTVVTAADHGDAHVTVPAVVVEVTFDSVVPLDPSLTSNDVTTFFDNNYQLTAEVDLRGSDATHSFVYRSMPFMTATSIGSYWTWEDGTTYTDHTYVSMNEITAVIINIWEEYYNPNNPGVTQLCGRVTDATLSIYDGVSDQALHPCSAAAGGCHTTIPEDHQGTVGGGALVDYAMIPGEPNIDGSTGHLKTFVATLTTPAGEAADLVVDLIVIGVRGTDGKQTLLTSEFENWWYVHDPPGGLSYASVSKGSSFSRNTYFTKEVERLWREDGGAYGGIYSEFEATLPLVGAINKMSYADIKLGGGRNSVYDFELVSEGHETITEMSTTETITTSDNPGFEVADPAFEGETDTVVIFGDSYRFTEGQEVFFDDTTRGPNLRSTVSWDLAGKPTMVLVSGYDIVAGIMPNLQRALAFEASPPQQLNIQNTLDKWQAVVDGLYAAYEETEPIRAEVVDEESFSPFSSLLGNASTSNVVFYGGSGTLERSFTDVSITTNFKDKLENVDYKNSIGTYTFDFVLSAVSFGAYADIEFEKRRDETDGTSTESESSSEVVIFLGDPENGDHFDVELLHAGESGGLSLTPVFKVGAGASKCPWAANTIKREDFSFVVDYATAVHDNVPADGEAIYHATLTALSPTEESFEVVIWIDAATNPDSLQVMMGGEFLNAPLPVLLSYGTPVELTFTAVRGPRAYTYDGVRIIASSACEYDMRWDMIRSPLSDSFEIGPTFMEPCPSIEWGVALKDEPEIVIGAGDALEVVGSVYNPQYAYTRWTTAAAEGRVDRVALEFRRDGDDTWQTAQSITAGNPDIVFHNGAEGSYGVGLFTWDIGAVADGLDVEDTFWIRGVVECTGTGPLAGDRESSTGALMVTVDQTRPVQFGPSQPADGEYEPGDSVSFAFDEDIDCDSFDIFVSVDGNAVAGAPLIDCRGNVVVVDLESVVLYDEIENTTVTVVLTGVHDLAGNVATQASIASFTVLPSNLANGALVSGIALNVAYDSISSNLAAFRADVVDQVEAALESEYSGYTRSGRIFVDNLYQVPSDGSTVMTLRIVQGAGNPAASVLADRVLGLFAAAFDPSATRALDADTGTPVSFVRHVASLRLARARSQLAAPTRVRTVVETREVADYTVGVDNIFDYVKTSDDFNAGVGSLDGNDEAETVYVESTGHVGVYTMQVMMTVLLIVNMILAAGCFKFSNKKKSKSAPALSTADGFDDDIVARTALETLLREVRSLDSHVRKRNGGASSAVSTKTARSSSTSSVSFLTTSTDDDSNSA